MIKYSGFALPVINLAEQLYLEMLQVNGCRNKIQESRIISVSDLIDCLNEAFTVTVEGDDCLLEVFAIFTFPTLGFEISFV